MIVKLSVLACRQFYKIKNGCLELSAFAFLHAGRQVCAKFTATFEKTIT